MYIVVLLLSMIVTQTLFPMTDESGERLFITTLMNYTKNNAIDWNILKSNAAPVHYNPRAFEDHSAQIFSYYPGLINKLPYISLGNLPTPVQKLDNVGSFLDMPHLFIKRDDLTGKVLPNGQQLFGGNKVRKLEPFLAYALYNNAKTIMTFGCAGSNHAAATAIYAELLGLRCICLLKDQPNAQTVQRNLLLMHHHNATMHGFTTYPQRNKAAIDIFIENKKVYGDFPCVIPPGASLPIGIVGYVNAAFELKEQVKQGLIPVSDYIYVACGSLGTMAGLLLGLKAADLPTQVIAINTDADEKPQELVQGVIKLFHETNKLLHSMDNEFPLFTITPEEVSILNDFCGSEYGLFTQEGIAALNLMKEKENIVLDGTYTSKAFAGLIQDVKMNKREQNVILFWNTWCSDPFTDELSAIDYKKLPSEFHRYFEQPVQDDKISTIIFPHKKATLVDVQKINPHIRINLFLKSGENPLDLKLYPSNIPCYIAQEVADALDKIQQELEKMGYGLEIRDGFRPLWAQKKLWEAILEFNLPNPDDYISNPYVEQGRHTRGTAVDVSLVYNDSGKPLPMPPFEFDQRAHQNYWGENLSAEQIKNREFLKSIMLQNGFTPIKSEWWHYDYQNWRDYMPLNYQFNEIPNIKTD